MDNLKCCNLNCTMISPTLVPSSMTIVIPYNNSSLMTFFSISIWCYINFENVLPKLVTKPRRNVHFNYKKLNSDTKSHH